MGTEENISFTSKIMALAYSLYRRAKGFSQRLYWLKNSIFEVIAFLITLILGVIKALPIKIENYDWWLAAFVTIWSLVNFLKKTLYFLFQLSLDYEIEDLEKLTSSNVKVNNDQKSKDEIHDFVLRGKGNRKEVQSIIYNRNVNSILEKATNQISLDTKSYAIHSIIKENLPFFLRNTKEFGIKTTDDLKVSLRTDLTSELLISSKRVQLQKSSYFRDRLSNTLANYEVKKGEDVILNLRKENVLTSNNELTPLSLSKLSNQLGSSTMLFTKDHYLIYLKQGKGLDENARRLTPSGSGSCDYDSSISGKKFTDYCKEQAKRELYEECGLKDSDIKEIRICGYGRYLYRNGKPEIFCIATTDKQSDNIKPPINEWQYQNRSFVGKYDLNESLNKNDIEKNLKEFLDELKYENRRDNHPPVSGPLFWNVMFAIDYFKSLDEKAIDQFFKDIK